MFGPARARPSFTYTLGPAGNRLSVTDHTGRVVDYTYDELYRLTREEIADPTTGTSFFAYTYDAVANRLTKEDVNGVVTSTYDDNDRILTRGGDSYSYDLNGNTLTALVAGVTTHYAYDYENRMMGADDGSKLVAYGYNADGIRAWSEVDGLRTHYLVDQNRDYAQVLEELDAGFVPSVTYVHGDDLLSQFRDGTRYSYHYDGHGSTIALTDHLETVTDTYTYDAWGELLASTGSTPNNYLYTGEQYDPNVGFYYLRARYYNPSLGRFHTMDTHPGIEYEPLTLHKYLYAGASPTLFVDPSGMIFVAGFSELLLSLNNASFYRGTSAQGARVALRQVLFGRPPKDLGLVGEGVLDLALQGVFDTIINNPNGFDSKSNFGTAAHHDLELKIASFKPLPGFEIAAEVYYDKNNKPTTRRAKGSLGIDVQIIHRGKVVLSLDLKTGKGWSKNGILVRKKRFGSDIIQIFVKTEASR